MYACRYIILALCKIYDMYNILICIDLEKYSKLISYAIIYIVYSLLYDLTYTLLIVSRKTAIRNCAEMCILSVVKKNGFRCKKKCQKIVQ